VERILAGSHNFDFPSQPLTWETILQEEPFEGQHWQGAYGLPNGSTVEDWGEESSDSDDLSLLDDAEYDDDTSSHESTRPIIQLRPLGIRDMSLEPSKATLGRAVVEALRDRQYWQFGWRTDASRLQKFNIGVPSSLGVEVMSNVNTRRKLMVCTGCIQGRHMTVS
jgi:gamma-tubulin complex component 5